MELKNLYRLILLRSAMQSYISFLRFSYLWFIIQIFRMRYHILIWAQYFCFYAANSEQISFEKKPVRCLRWLTPLIYKSQIISLYGLYPFHVTLEIKAEEEWAWHQIRVVWWICCFRREVTYLCAFPITCAVWVQNSYRNTFGSGDVCTRQRSLHKLGVSLPFVLHLKWWLGIKLELFCGYILG